MYEFAGDDVLVMKFGSVINLNMLVLLCAFFFKKKQSRKFLV